MSCYFRHLKGIFDEAGIEVTPDNRKQVDHAIHEILSINYKDCPHAWKAIKLQIVDDEQKRWEFIQKLKVAVD
ncbi:MAG: hypothetical protein JSV54_01075 [Chloroflexota bacterium]|nr:MAG: hypothetical protein JSV54_01075 [Chloroflexota bacterium]